MPLLVLELVPGKTLAERLKKGRLAVEEALVSVARLPRGWSRRMSKESSIGI